MSTTQLQWFPQNILFLFFFFPERSTKLPVNSSSLWLGSSHGQTRTCPSLIALSALSQSHYLTCTLAVKLTDWDMHQEAGEEAETRRTLPFLAPCLQLASLTGSQRSPKLTCSMACVPLPQGHPDFPCPCVFFSEMFWPAEVAEHA